MSYIIYMQKFSFHQIFKDLKSVFNNFQIIFVRVPIFLYDSFNI